MGNKAEAHHEFIHHYPPLEVQEAWGKADQEELFEDDKSDENNCQGEKTCMAFPFETLLGKKLYEGQTQEDDNNQYIDQTNDCHEGSIGEECWKSTFSCHSAKSLGHQAHQGVETTGQKDGKDSADNGRQRFSLFTNGGVDVLKGVEQKG